MNLKNAILDGFKTMKDGSLKITLVTRELSPEQMAKIISNLNKEVLSIDIPEEQSEVKSPSQRLRGVLYKIWESHEKEKFDSFELFYRHMMEKIIDYYKEKI